MSWFATEAVLRRKLTRAEFRIQYLIEALRRLRDNPESENAQAAANATIKIAEGWVTEE